MLPKGDVSVSLEIAIEKIDTLEQTYTANLSVTLRYGEGTIKERKGLAVIEPWPENGQSEQIWTPQICTWNEFDSSEDSVMKINQSMPNGERVLRYSRCVSGMYLLDFNEFPFDEQRLDFTLLLDPQPRYVLKDVCVSDLETEFEIVDIKDKHIPQARIGLGSGEVTLDKFCVSIFVQRHPKFYLLNFYSVTYGIVMLQCTCIGIDIDDLAARIQTTLDLLLALAAFKISVATQVPKSTEQTILDKQVVFAVVFLALGALQSLVISFEIAEDAWMTVMDMYFTAAFALSWTALNLFLIYHPEMKRSRKPRYTSHQEEYNLEKMGDNEGASRSYWVRRKSELQSNYATF